MPSIITHELMAEKVLRSLDDGLLKDTINAHKQEFMIGANGPDFLYYFDAMPWSDQKARASFTYLANDIHADKVNDFYRLAIKLTTAQNDGALKERMIAYLAGHLCHWALDCTAHPFIFYRTDGTTLETKYWHYRYEAMIDTWMYDRLQEEQLITMPPAGLIEADPDAVRAISALYPPIVKELWDFDMTAKHVGKALHDFRTILMLVYDPIGVWFNIIQLIELINKNKWSMTGHFLLSKKDETHDILNLTNQKWCHPCDCSQVHHESFVDLFDASLVTGSAVLDLYAKVINKGKAAPLLAYIDDRSYDTGLKERRSMKYFDSIY